MFRELIPVFTVAVALAMGLCAAGAADAPVAATLEIKLDALRTINRAQLTQPGRAELIEKHKALVNEYADDPKVAESMLTIADLLGWENESKGVKSDLAGAFEWYKKAADRAVAGSDVWIQAKMTHAQMLHFRGQPGGPEQVECRKLLEEIERGTVGNQFAQARVTLEFVRQSHWEGNVEAAERYCKKLQDWPASNPEDPDHTRIEQALPAWRQAAAQEVIAAWVNTLGPKDTILANVSRVARDHADIGGIQAYADQMSKQVGDKPADPPLVYEASLEQPAGRPDWRRRAFLIGNLVVILLLTAVTLRNRSADAAARTSTK